MKDRSQNACCAFAVEWEQPAARIDERIIARFQLLWEPMPDRVERFEI